MGRMKDLLMNDPIAVSSMVKNAMNMEQAGYIDFLEKELERKDKALKAIEENNKKIFKLLNNNK